MNHSILVDRKFCLYFANDSGKQVGCLKELDSGELSFEGEVDAAATCLFDNLISVNSEALKKARDAKTRAEEELARRDDSSFHRNELFNRLCKVFEVEESEGNWFEFVDLIEKRAKGTRPIWNNCQRIADIDRVDRALRNFSEDPTNCSGVMVVEAVLKAIGEIK